jgi:hypothetical protein
MPLPPALLKRTSSDPVRISGFPEPGSGLGACFGEFLRRAVPSHTAYAVARGLCDDVAAALRAELYPKGVSAELAGGDHLITGAVGKRTSVAPIIEVDMLYMLPPKLTAQKAGDALKIAWAVLKTRFADVTIADTGVLVPRGVGAVKVLPCREHGGAYLIPGTPTLTRASGWSITNPIAEAATLRLSDSLYGGRPRLLMTALKSWRLHAEVPVQSFALELLAQEFYSGAPRPYELERALIDFWAWARHRTPCALKPPGGQTAIDVTDAWHGKAKAAYWRATLADHHIKAGKIGDAIEEWRQVLGPNFPTAR